MRKVLLYIYFSVLVGEGWCQDRLHGDRGHLDGIGKVSIHNFFLY